MALLNPVYGLVVPFLFVITVPLAIFAGITTTLAFSVLMFRVAIVYVDIALQMVPQYLLGHGSRLVHPVSLQYSRLDSVDGAKSPMSPRSMGSLSGKCTTLTSPISTASHFKSSGYKSPRRRSRTSLTSSTSGVGFATATVERRSHRSSQVSLGTITPIREDSATSAPVSTGHGLSLSTGIDRDYEGIGGWRLDDETDAEAWEKMYTRFQRQMDRTSGRHHQRALSSGAITPGDGGVLMMKQNRRGCGEDDEEGDRSSTLSPVSALASAYRTSTSPNSSRLRINHAGQPPTPLTAIDKKDGYFPQLSPKILRKGLST